MPILVILNMKIILYSSIHEILLFHRNNIFNLIVIIIHTNTIIPNDFDSDLCDILKRMLNKDPAKSITLDEKQID